MPTSLSIWSTGITTIVIGIACVTDLRWRRIPNLVTFPAILLSVIVHILVGGWGGFALSLSGSLLAPVLLCILHAGKGPGGGDIKLASVMGANLGPILGTLAILISAAAGGILAVVWMLVVRFRKEALPSLLGSDADGEADEPDQGEDPRGSSTVIPYGLALTVGTLATLFIYWSGGGAQWLM